MGDQAEDNKVELEIVGTASALTCAGGNRYAEMNGQPLVWA